MNTIFMFFSHLKIFLFLQDVREEMKAYIRETSNEQIFIEFGGHLRREDYFIYNIPFVDDNISDGDDDDD